MRARIAELEEQEKNSDAISVNFKDIERMA